MSVRTFYVSSVKVHRRHRGHERWSFGIAVDDERPYPTIGYHLATFEVECVTKAEAQGVVLHWLAQGRPAGMTVRQVFPLPARATTAERLATVPTSFDPVHTTHEEHLSMDPITLTITLDLDREMAPAYTSGVGPDGEGHAEPRTFADVVATIAARALVDDLRRDSEVWTSMRRQVAEVRTEVIRAAVEPAVAEALDQELVRTDEWGTPVPGAPAVSLRKLVHDEAMRALTKAVGGDGRDTRGLTLVQRIVQDQVTKVLSKELAEEVAAAKAEVRDRVHSVTAELLAGAVVKAVTS